MSRWLRTAPMIGLNIAVWAAAGSAQAQQVGSAQRGLRLAREVCAQCHAVDNGPRRSGNASAPAFADIANTPGMTSIALAAALRTSHRTMPNIVIKGRDADDIIAYILSLKKGG